MEREKNEVSSREKWILAILLAMLFLIFATPLAFQTGNRFLALAKLSYLKDGRVTGIGWVLHAIAFALVVRLIMA